MPRLANWTKLNSCCCGCSLKTGTIIIGGIQLAFSLILVVLGIIILALGLNIDGLSDELLAALKENFGGVGTDVIRNILLILGGILLGVSIIAVIADACLIHGARKVRWGSKM